MTTFKKGGGGGGDGSKFGGKRTGPPEERSRHTKLQCDNSNKAIFRACPVNLQCEEKMTSAMQQCHGT